MTTAMVLSAGLGTRLRPLTDELAKPLMPIGDRPILAHVLETLAQGGVSGFVLNTHHRPADFATRIGELGFDVQVVHEPELLGTAGAVAHAASALGEGEIVVWNGDVHAPELDVAALVERRRAERFDALWVVQPLVGEGGAVGGGTVGGGTVGLDREGNIVRLRGQRFGIEVAGANFLGIQAMSASLRSTLPREGCLVGDVALPLLRRGGRIASFVFVGSWDDIGSPEALLQANLRWLDRRGIDSWIAPDAQVEMNARLDRSIVGAGSRVSGTGIARRCVVFPGATLEAPADGALVGRRFRCVVPA